LKFLDYFKLYLNKKENKVANTKLKYIGVFNIDMKTEMDGKLIQIIEGSNDRVKDYLDFMNKLSQDPDNYTLSRYSKIDEQRIIEWSKSWGKSTIMILAYNDSKVVGFFQATRGKYFGPDRQFHVQKYLMQLMKNLEVKD